MEGLETNDSVTLSIIENGADHILKVSIPIKVYDIIKSYIPRNDEYVTTETACEILQRKGYFCKTNTTLIKYAMINKVQSIIRGKRRYFNREQLNNIPQK